MKAALLAVVAATVCCSVVGVDPARAAGCTPDYAFKSQVGQLVTAAGFLTTVTGARSLEQQRAFDVLHRQFTAQKAEPLPPLTQPCSRSAAFQDAVKQAALVRGSLVRVASLVAGWPVNRAATRAQWRPVLRTAAAGAAAELRLATDVGDAKIKLSQLAAQLAALRLQLKG